MPESTTPSPAGGENDRPETRWQARARYYLGPDARCQLVPARAGYYLGPDAPCQFAPGENVWPAKVLNVSAGGIGILVSRRFEPGTFLNVVLRGKGRGFAFLLQVRGVYASEEAPDQYVLGGAFLTQLTVDELQALLAERFHE